MTEATVATEAKVTRKRTLIGKVVSDKRAKTVTVLIERRVKHELYGKIVGKSSKYHAVAVLGQIRSRWPRQRLARRLRCSRFQVHSRLPARPSMCPVMSRSLRSSKPRALMKSGA